MSDLVQRLRTIKANGIMCDEAADRIEALESAARMALDAIKAAYSRHDVAGQCSDAVAALTEALDK